MEITIIIAIYGAVLSTIVFAYSIQTRRDKVKISYSRVDIDSKYYWAFLVVNNSRRNLYLKNFWLSRKSGERFVLRNCEDIDGIDISSITTLEPNRSIEVYYAEKYIKMNDADLRSFSVEEENGKYYFLDRKHCKHLHRSKLSIPKKIRNFFVSIIAK